MAFAFPAGAAASGSADGTEATEPAEAAGPPRASSMRCVSGCVTLNRAATYATVAIEGTGLADVTKVEFLAYRSKRRVRRKRARAKVSAEGVVTARIPRGLHRSRVRIRLHDAEGYRSRVLRRSMRVEPRRDTRLKEGEDPLVPATSLRPSAIGYGGEAETTFSYLARAREPVDVEIQIVRTRDGATVKTLREQDVEPTTRRSITWDGRLESGAPAEPGRYRIAALVQPRATRASASQSTTRGHNVRRVSVVRGVYPIQGSYTYSLSAGRFGAPRGGYAHQGQDMMSPCGTPLVAALGGVVQTNRYQSAAGYYVVIDLDDGGSHAYMHLRRPSPVKAGQRVAAGEPLGEVGQTGRASGCHLHFEWWTAPGWYKGGRPIDPIEKLKEWEGS